MNNEILRRIIAWILLIGFLFLIINLIFIQWEVTISIVIYLIIMVYYLLVMNKKKDESD